MNGRTRQYSLITGIVLAVGFIATVPRSYAQQPFVVKRVSKPLFIDGNIDEPEWRAAKAFPPFVFHWYTEGKKEQTEAKILWDDTFLYVAFKCDDAHIAGVRTRRNDEVYEDDTVEVFIAPNINTPLVYMNYEINCIGTYLVGRHPDKKTAVRIEPPCLMIGRSHNGTINNETDEDDWWILEIAIPFDNFTWTGLSAPPKAGARMRLNLNRLGGVVNRQASQWKSSNIDKLNFHVPESFGEVILSGEQVLPR